jgi:filamentous hemagglutinin
MSLQIRRGTAAQLAVITPVIGELIYTTDTQVVYVGDGTTTGGIPIAVGGSGNVSGTNLLTGGIASATGNVTGGNIRTAGQVSATGNITTAGLYLGNGSALTGVTASAVDALSLTGNTIANTVLYSSLTTVGILSNVSISGNVNGGNLRTVGQVSSTGNVTGGNILTGGNVSATTNVTGGNLVTGGTASATGNITGGNLVTGGQVTATGNVTGNYLRSTLDINAGGNVIATSHTGTSVSVTANVTGGNISTVGNVSGNYILGNGSLLTGIDATGIQSGTSNVKVSSPNGNVTVTVGGTSNIFVVASAGIYTTGISSVTGTITAGNLVTGGTVSATGNITGGNVTLDTAAGNIVAHDLSLGGLISAVGNITGGNVTLDTAVGNIVAHDITLAGVASVAGTITGGNLTVGTGTVSIGSLVNNNANAVGNIGSSSKYFNTVFAKATSAQYADLAENYTADAEYAPGTVVIFGGEQEITISTEVADERVAGAISTEPAHLMNSGQAGLPVALRGRVPVKLIGAVTKGDGLVTSSTAGYAQSVGRSRLYAQAVFAKALETDLADGEKTIVAVIL